VNIHTEAVASTSGDLLANVAESYKPKSLVAEIVRLHCGVSVVSAEGFLVSRHSGGDAPW
jgi:hypothetical protein